MWKTLLVINNKLGIMIKTMKRVEVQLDSKTITWKNSTFENVSQCKYRIQVVLFYKTRTVVLKISHHMLHV